MPSWVPRIDTPRRATEQQASGPLNGPSLVDLTFVGLGVDGLFLQVACSVPGWLSFYASAAARLADGARTVDQDPAAGSGVLLDLLFADGVTQLSVAPGSSYHNAETPLQQRIWARLRSQQSGAHTASVTVLALVLNDAVGG